MNDILAPASHQPAWPGTPAGPAVVLLRRLATLRSTVSVWRERKRFRWQLKQMLEANPHLIDDIGLTRRQAEAEVAKLPFWQR